jgi:hypothetical protein
VADKFEYINEIAERLSESLRSAPWSNSKIVISTFFSFRHFRSRTGTSGTQCFLPLNLVLTTEVPPPPVSSSALNEPLVHFFSLAWSPSHCVNRIITIHFLEGQISCSSRVCMVLPFPIDNHVCSSVGFTAQSSVNTTIPASQPSLSRDIRGGLDAQSS